MNTTFPTLAQIEDARARVAAEGRDVPAQHVLALLDDMRRLIEERSQEGNTDRARFLRRCACAWDCGHARLPILQLLARWADLVLRLEYNLTLPWIRWPLLRAFARVWRQRQRQPAHDQLRSTRDAMESEMHRLRAQRTGDGGVRTLAGDEEGYGAVQFLAVLTHPCQICAEDRRAWHTRFGFCPHKETWRC